MPSQPTQNRAAPGSRLVQSKPGAWSAANSQANSQPHESVGGSWAQAMNTRSANQLDLSSSSFPSLAGGSGSAQTPGASSSQWQAGPPAAREQQAPPNPRMIQQRQNQSRGEGFNSDFASMDPGAARFQSIPRGAPPGLAPTDGMSPEGSVPSRKTPVNGSIGQERSHNEPTSIQTKMKEFTREALSPPLQPSEPQSPYDGMSEKDKWGMSGYEALHSGPMAQYRNVERQQDIAAFEHYAATGQPLLRNFAGAFAPANAFPPKPLNDDFKIPDCYVVHNVAPINQRISGFTEDTLFYIFYTSPKDIIQEEVATELMSRKWRFHMKEKMWLTRDDTTSNPQILEKDVSEQGYYIWWDYRNWKRVRKMYILRYEDLDDHLSGGRSLTMPGLFQGGFGMMGGSNGALNGFNAVPGLERLAAMGGRGF